MIPEATQVSWRLCETLIILNDTLKWYLMILKALKYNKWILIVGLEQIDDPYLFESTVKVLFFSPLHEGIWFSIMRCNCKKKIKHHGDDNWIFLPAGLIKGGRFTHQCTCQLSPYYLRWNKEAFLHLLTWVTTRDDNVMSYTDEMLHVHDGCCKYPSIYRKTEDKM
jgi:hypothetical protein